MNRQIRKIWIFKNLNLLSNYLSNLRPEIAKQLSNLRPQLKNGVAYNNKKRVSRVDSQMRVPEVMEEMKKPPALPATIPASILEPLVPSRHFRHHFQPFRHLFQHPFRHFRQMSEGMCINYFWHFRYFTEVSTLPQFRMFIIYLLFLKFAT